MKKCDLCKKKYSLYIKFGKQFLANHYLNNYSYDAKVAYCDRCIIFKCIHQISNKKIFQLNYPYLSSLSFEFQKYLRNIALELKKKIKKGKILEIGSNDGSFLKHFKKTLYTRIGIEPAYSSHKIAKKNGINSLNHYFDKKTYNFLSKKYKSFDIIFSINTFAHIDKINKNFELINLLINKKNKKSIFVFENIDIFSLVKKINFPQLYDEHVYTMSANCINNICKKNKLVLFDIKKTNNQDGSYRYYIGHGQVKQKKVVKKIIKQERLFLNTNRIVNLNKQIIQIKRKAKSFFIKNKSKIYGFGASAKATFLVNFLSLNENNIKFIFDNSPYKTERNLPGTKIKIKNESMVKNIKDCILFIFIPNHIKEIQKKYSKLLKKNNIRLMTINDI